MNMSKVVRDEEIFFEETEVEVVVEVVEVVEEKRKKNEEEGRSYFLH